MTTVAIIGAGLIGRAWAFVFARAGMAVQVWDKSPQVRASLPADLALMLTETVPFGCAGADPDGLIGRIRICAELADALQGADLVQESGPEVPRIKSALFAQLDQLAPDQAVIASSSSALMVSSYTQGLAGQGRCLVGHPVNPPHLVPVVELSPGPETTAATLDRAEAIYRAAGQVPVRLSREIDGFILNRLQAVVLAESLRLVADGVVSVQGLDDVIRHGLGRRWAFMGPLRTISLNAPAGVLDYLQRYGPTMARLADDAARGDAFSEAAAQAVAAGLPQLTPEQIRDDQHWRDGELAALGAHLAQRRDKVSAPSDSLD